MHYAQPRRVPDAAPRQVTVGISDFMVVTDDSVLSTVGLGSCVAIALHARGEQVAALAHVLLPTSDGAVATPLLPARYADSAVGAMVRRMRDVGVRSEIVARLAGGSSMFPAMRPAGGVSLGQRNVDAAREACAVHRIAIIAEDVGGAHGRAVHFDVATGIVRVASVLRDDVIL